MFALGLKFCGRPWSDAIVMLKNLSLLLFHDPKNILIRGFVYIEQQNKGGLNFMPL